MYIITILPQFQRPVLLALIARLILAFMKEKIKLLVGGFLIYIMPKKAAALANEGMTITNYETFSQIDRLMRNTILKKTEKDKDFDKLAELQRNYWLNQGAQYFARMNKSFQEAFLPDCAFIFDLLQQELEKETEHFNTLVEIGTGNGRVLNYLQSKFPQINKFIGIDLSQEQIDINTKNNAGNSKLEFVASDAYEWTKVNGSSYTIFVTSRGVLEYFTEKRLTEFLSTLNQIGNIYFVAIEPNGVDHDFSINPNSQPYGHERSFSHNYALLFEKAGFQFWHQSTKHTDKANDYYFSFIGVKN